jgi:clan AA aspartic protease
MITGTVSAQLQALIQVTIQGPSGQRQDVETVIDTGFTGALTLPRAIIATLGLVWRSQANATLANGSVVTFDLYDAVVIWDGMMRKIVVCAADANSLLGMKLLEGHALRADIKVGGMVTIEALP